MATRSDQACKRVVTDPRRAKRDQPNLRSERGGEGRKSCPQAVPSHENLSAGARTTDGGKGRTLDPLKGSGEAAVDLAAARPRRRRELQVVDHVSRIVGLGATKRDHPYGTAIARFAIGHDGLSAADIHEGTRSEAHAGQELGFHFPPEIALLELYVGQPRHFHA